MIELTSGGELKGYGLLKECPEVTHFVTTRSGGVSTGHYATFNVSPHTNDSAADVLHNRQLLLERLAQPVRQLLVPKQVHGCESVVIDASYGQQPLDVRHRLLQGIDTLMTDVPGYCICVTTADCVPVLLYDRRNRAVAAVHAGWRGTVAHIVRRTIERMNQCYGTEGGDLLACIGPSISLASFEVGDEVCEAFRKGGFDLPKISARNHETGKWHIDLWEANRSELLRAGVSAGRIEVAGICTYIRHEEFFSARRLGIDSGRILSGIMLKEYQ